MQSGRLAHAFTPIAQTAARWTGSPHAFIIACLFVVGWALSGPLFGFSSTWQLVINTGTTIITFLLVVLIQHTQNAGDAATHIKLDALLEADARDDDSRYIGIEDLTEPELQALKAAMREEVAQIKSKRTGGTQ